MKNVVIVISCLTMAHLSTAQTTGADEIESTIEINPAATLQYEDSVFTLVDEQPTFEGGLTSWYNYVFTSIKYPQEAYKNDIQGKVFVQFIVNKEGQIRNPVVLKGFNEACEKEALRVVANSPDWQPGKHHGHLVDVKMVLPITFKIN